MVPAFTNAYHPLPARRSESLRRFLTFTNLHLRGDGITHSTATMWYVGLELVVYGAVELGDVVLFFIGEQGLFGREVLTRLVWHFD